MSRPTLTLTKGKIGNLDTDKFMLNFENVLCSVWKNQALIPEATRKFTQEEKVLVFKKFESVMNYVKL